MGAIKNLLNSEKAVALGVLIIAATVLTAIGEMSIEMWTEYTKWIALFYIGGKTVQGVATAVTDARKSEAMADVAVAAKQAGDKDELQLDKIAEFFSTILKMQQEPIVPPKPPGPPVDDVTSGEVSS